MFGPRRLFRALAFLILMGPVVFVFAPPAMAQNPNKPYVEEVDVTFLAPNLTAQCGVDIYANVVGTVTFKDHPDGSTQVRFRYHHIFSGPGGSLTVKRVENANITLTVLPDGTEVENVRTSGALMYHFVIPGYGTIGNNSGHEVYQATWAFDPEADEWILVDEQIFFDAGPNNEISEAEYDLICSLLT